MIISTIIVNFNGLQFTEAAITSLLQHNQQQEIVVVDNGSTDASVESLRRDFSAIKVISLPTNIGFGRANNIGARHAEGELLFFLNNDTYLTQDAVTKLAMILKEHRDAAACGPRLVNPNGSYQFSTGCDPSILGEWKTKRQERASRITTTMGLIGIDSLTRPLEVDWVTGAALMVRRKVFEQISGFDEHYFMYFEDADLCRRIRNEGWKIVYDPSSELVHHRGGSGVIVKDKVGLEYRKSQLYYYKKHNPKSSTLMLQVYLLLKYGLRWLRFTPQPGKSDERSFASDIIRLLRT